MVDLRSPFAYAALHIAGSVNIVDELFEELVRDGLPFSRSRPVLLACPVGERSVRYAALLARLGIRMFAASPAGSSPGADGGGELVRE